MPKQLTPLRDLIILKNVAVTKMPLATVAKNHSLTKAHVIHKARHMAELVTFVAADSLTQSAKRFHLTRDELDAIMDYHTAHAGSKGGE